MVFNITAVRTSSGGVWEGDNPLQFAFPLLIIQTIIVILTSRLLVFLLKPFRQPKVIAEILGGILLGPSAFGRNEKFLHYIFPTWSTPILESVASLGLLFFLFLVGLELDLTIIRRSGRKAFIIAAAGVSLPFLFGAGVTFVLRKTIKEIDRVGYAQSLMFMGVSLSITAFPVLARILAELKLLTTEIGQTAMAAAAFNDVAAWILLALAVAVAGGSQSSPMVSLWVLLSGIGFVAFMIIFVRPIMIWVAKRSSSGTSNNDNIVDEAYLCLTFAAVMLCGFMTDLIGIHAIFGAFIFGLTIPKDGEFAGKLIKRIEDFVCGLLLPLYFASSGIKTNVATIHGLESWGLLLLVISTASAGKVLGTFAVAMLCKIPARDSLALGMLMNTKGLVELIVLNIGKEKKVLDEKMFAILVTMALVTTFMTTPAVSIIYKPMRCIRPPPLPEKSSTSKRSREELRVVACVRIPRDSSSLINLIEAFRSTYNFAIKLYVMQLFQLTDRSSSLVMVQRARKNGLPFIGRLGQGDLSDQVAAAFSAYSHLGQVTVRPTKAISGFSVMHEDICHIAEKKRAEIIILPFHKQWRWEDDQEFEVNSGNGWRIVHQNVLVNSPCSVAVLLDRGFGDVHQQSLGYHDVPQKKRVCILFLGGPDSRKALEVGCRMADHPAITVSVIRFIEHEEHRAETPSHPEFAEISNVPKTHDGEKELDKTILQELRTRGDGAVELIEMETDDIVEEVLTIAQRGRFDLLIVGKGRFPAARTVKLENRNAEYTELGYIGDLLATSGKGVRCSVLVIQQHDPNQEHNIANGGTTEKGVIDAYVA